MFIHLSASLSTGGRFPYRGAPYRGNRDLNRGGGTCTEWGQGPVQWGGEGHALSAWPARHSWHRKTVLWESWFLIGNIQVVRVRHNISVLRPDIAAVMKVYWCFPWTEFRPKYFCVLLHLSVSLLLDYQKRKGRPGPKIDKTDEFFIDSYCLSGGGCAVCLEGGSFWFSAC